MQKVDLAKLSPLIKLIICYEITLEVIAQAQFNGVAERSLDAVTVAQLDFACVEQFVTGFYGPIFIDVVAQASHYLPCKYGLCNVCFRGVNSIITQ